MTELVILRAADEATLRTEMKRLLDFLDRVHEVALANVAYTCSRTHGPAVIAFVADTVHALRERLFSSINRLSSSTVRRIRDKSGTYYDRQHLLGDGNGRLAFVYPGVNGFYPGMLRDLVVQRPECRRAFDELEEAMADIPYFTPSNFIFPPAPCYQHDADIFRSGAYAQALVATYAANVALSRILSGCGIRADGVTGFAGGDLAACVRSGAAGEHPTRDVRMKIVRDIYDIVHKAVNHGGLPQVAMLTVLMRHPDELDAVLPKLDADKVTLAIDFSTRQKTFAVAADYAETARQIFTEAGVRVMKLPLDRPFNTPRCESLVPAIRKFAMTWMKSEPVCDVYSCATADRVPTGVKNAREDVAQRWSRPVRFTDTIRRMHADGYRVFLEVGPHGLMTKAIADTLKGVDHAAIAMDAIHRSTHAQVQHALAQLAALGAAIDLASFFRNRSVKWLDFNAALSMEVRKTAEMQLSRVLPHMTLFSTAADLTGKSVLAEPRGRGAKAILRANAVARQNRQRQFDFGAMNPLVSDAEKITAVPGVSAEIVKTFRLSELPFLGDYALGTSQMSYSDPNLKGLLLLSISVGAEIMAETACLIVPNRNLVRIEDFNTRRRMSFRKGMLRLTVRAEIVASAAPNEIAIKVQLRDDAPDSALTWPVMEGTFVLSDAVPQTRPLLVDPLSHPRSVHWSGRDIYPTRLCCGKRLRGIDAVELWSESGMDYEVIVPPRAGNVVSTRFPMWVVNPLLIETIATGFALWRSHERFRGALAIPFRLRRLTLSGFIPDEGSRLKCYLRLAGVTERSQICTIDVTDGNGQQLIAFEGWEELTERAPNEYREIIMQPATTFLSAALTPETLGEPATDVASAYLTDVPYPIFERNEELWLRVLSNVVLSAPERQDFAAMTGSAARRTEWLFGRMVAKEAVRRFLKDFYQARWSDADITIWADDAGKPHALGEWHDYLTTHLDIAIAHTSQFIVALAAANARVGVDVEHVGRNLSDEFAQGVFTPEELEIAAQTANAAMAIIRFWCAKEAVSKALGTGIRYSPREMNVTSYQVDSGTVSVRLSGAWVDAFKNFKGRDIPVSVRTVRDHALAACFIPDSLFADP